MNKAQQNRYESLYRKHVSALKRQGKADSTIDVYSRAVRRITEFFDCPPDVLALEQFEAYFEALVQTHSWSTVKIDRNGLQFFYKYVLKNTHLAGNLISSTVGNWKGKELSEKLELEVGKDLQFIRVNGTLVGGLVGLIIYTVSEFFL